MSNVLITDLSGRQLEDVSDLTNKATLSETNIKKLGFLRKLSGKVLGRVLQLAYPKSSFYEVKNTKIQASQILPFRIAFTSIVVKPYDNQYSAPIGIAVVGFNNYIL
jgi:hypothetical protein